MFRFKRCNDSNCWRKLKKRFVKLISLNNYKISIVKLFCNKTRMNTRTTVPNKGNDYSKVYDCDFMVISPGVPSNAPVVLVFILVLLLKSFTMAFLIFSVGILLIFIAGAKFKIPNSITIFFKQIR